MTEENNAKMFENDSYKIVYDKTNFPIDKGCVEIVSYTITDKKDNQSYKLNMETGRRMDTYSPTTYPLDAKISLTNLSTNERISLSTSGDNVRHDIGSIDGIMDFYQKLQEGEFSAYNATPEKNKALSEEVLKVMDSYIFNTPQAREVLQEHINKSSHKNNTVLSAAQLQRFKNQR